MKLCYCDETGIGSEPIAVMVGVVVVGRCLGIAFAHAPTLILGLDAKDVSSSHPTPIERILAFTDQYFAGANPLKQREVDLPCAFLMMIASQLVFMKHQT